MVAEPRSNVMQLEDPLSYLPCSTISEYRKGQVMCEPGQRCPHLFLVIEGCVKISRFIDENEIVVDLCQADDFFGEAAFLGIPASERAVALETSRVMSWPVESVHDLIARHPQLGIALVQLLARRTQEMGERMGTLSVDCTSRRLAKALLSLSGRMGQPDLEAADVYQLTAFPHKLLAQYIGTTREAVTHCMNQFRRQGFLAYSRRGMTVHAANVRQWLEQPGKNAAAATAAAASAATSATVPQQRTAAAAAGMAH